MGSKNKDNAEASGKKLETKSGDPVPKKDESALQCDKDNKHWVGVRVEDEAGKLVDDVTVHLKLPDNSEEDVDMATAALGKDGAYRTCKSYDPGTCTFSFPTLYNLEWWPKGGAAGAATATQSATVADGDCTSSIAEGLGFRAYHSIWDRAENAALKKTRPTPNHLTVKDELKAPNQKDKTDKKAMDQVWTFVVKTKKPTKLRIVLTDRDGKALGSKSWELKTPIVDSGKTGADGLMEVKELPGKYKAATVAITVRDAITPPAKPAPGAAPDPLPYPIPIVVADFKDKFDPPPLDKLVVEVELKIGSLETFKLNPGTLGRLHNLGFGCDVDSDAPHIKKAVQAYQRWFLKNNAGSGKPEDVQDDVQKRHDKL